MDLSFQLLEASKYQEKAIQMLIQLLEGIKYQHEAMGISIELLGAST